MGLVSGAPFVRISEQDHIIGICFHNLQEYYPAGFLFWRLMLWNSSTHVLDHSTNFLRKILLQTSSAEFSRWVLLESSLENAVERIENARNGAGWTCKILKCPGEFLEDPENATALHVDSNGRHEGAAALDLAVEVNRLQLKTTPSLRTLANVSSIDFNEKTPPAKRALAPLQTSSAKRSTE